MLSRLALMLSLAVPAWVGAPSSALAQLDARDMEICRQSCMARARDASDPRYKSCVRTRCMGQRERRATAPRRDAQPRSPAQAGPAIGLWAVATHEALGDGVMTQAQQGVLGLSCTPEGAALRATNGLFKGPVMGWITDNGGAGGTIALSPGNAYSEQRADACGLGIAGLAAAGAVVLVDAAVTPLGRGQGFAVALPQGSVTVMSGAELQFRVPGATTLPAQGLANGIATLGATCPVVAAALRVPCP